MDFIKSLLPPGDGLLPYYMLLVAVPSIGNTIQNYKTLHFTRRLYNGRYIRNPNLPPATDKFHPEDSVKKLVPAHTDPKAIDQITPLGARIFATWTLIACVVRLYAAYHLNMGPVYNMAYWTYIIAFAHYVSELFFFKSMTFGLPQFFPFTLATIALIWMPSVRSYYVQIE